jgi:hypothetical protein
VAMEISVAEVKGGAECPAHGKEAYSDGRSRAQ